jgi:hypothetical protein
LFYQQVLAQQPKDKNKIYSLHEPDVYVIAKGKGKDHKQYEYGNKVSIRIIVAPRTSLTNITSITYCLLNGLSTITVSVSDGSI